MRKAEDQPSVNVLVRANPAVHYTIKFTVNGHRAAIIGGATAHNILGDGLWTTAVTSSSVRGSLE
jgi:hypothetical protein